MEGKESLKTFRLHLIYSIGEGLLDGFFLMNGFIFVKNLHGNITHLSFLFQASIIMYLFSVVTNTLLKQVNSKRRVINLTAIATRLPLALFYFFPSGEPENNVVFFQMLFLFIFLVFYSSRTLVFPIINEILKYNYDNASVGKLYGYATTIRKVVIMVSTFIFGVMLDKNNDVYRLVYPVLGVVGVISISAITFCSFPDALLQKKAPLKTVLKKMSINLLALLRWNKFFREFEIAFMLYGFAFMVCYPVVTLYFEEQLHLNYSSIAFYQYFYNGVAILVLPFVGKYIDRLDPRRFAIFTYSYLLLYLISILSCQWFDFYVVIANLKIHLMIFIAYFFLGLFNANMALQFHIGSSYFSPTNRVADYQASHLTLTGIRAAIFPIVGIYIYEAFSYNGTFLAGIVALFASILFLRGRIKKKGLLK